MGNQICCGSWHSTVVEDRLTRPQRLSRQPSNLDYKKLRRLIRARKLAPCFDGEDDPRFDLEECPICFLFFPSLNRSRCCKKGICTECFLQMKPNGVQNSPQCPFCKTHHYAVEYFGARSNEEKALEQEEEQKVIEIKIRTQSQDSFVVSPGMLVDGTHPILEVHLPRQCFQGLCEVLSDLPLEGSAADSDESLPSSSRCTGRHGCHAEDSLVMEATWQYLKDPGLWTSGILQTNVEEGAFIHVKEDYSNSRIVIGGDLLEHLDEVSQGPSGSATRNGLSTTHSPY